ncbi:Lipoprotein-releasing system transmembrane protein LolE [bioreactor metagenome]|uniref:Lipoprotein-releasing system transmembrane protein LolE n=1 Tax=bioreactor metagenome TaxID=1076179 RepID=A0A645IRI9_9ZZZZ
MEAFNVQNRYEQQEEAYRMTEIEKWITFLILTFILLIAAFNVIGSLSMLMIDKREDIGILRNLGATDRFIRRIFLYEGWMISLLGATIGLVVGIALCLIQEHYGMISLGGGSGSFVTDTYPVKLMWNDVFIVALVVGAIGFLTAWYPVKRMLNKPR